MPAYDFACPEHGVQEQHFSFSEYDQLDRDERGNALAPCIETGCQEITTRRLQLFGNISTSDDPSFGSSPGEHRNREFAGFDPDNQGWTDPVDSRSNKGWEYGD